MRKTCTFAHLLCNTNGMYNNFNLLAGEVLLLMSNSSSSLLVKYKILKKFRIPGPFIFLILHNHMNLVFKQHISFILHYHIITKLSFYQSFTGLYYTWVTVKALRPLVKEKKNGSFLWLLFVSKDNNYKAKIHIQHVSHI